MSEDKNKFIVLYHFLNNPQDFNFEMNYYEFRDELKTLLDLYNKEKEKNKILSIQIIENEKLYDKETARLGNLIQELLQERN